MFGQLKKHMIQQLADRAVPEIVKAIEKIESKESIKESESIVFVISKNKSEAMLTIHPAELSGDRMLLNKPIEVMHGSKIIESLLNTDDNE